MKAIFFISILLIGCGKTPEAIQPEKLVDPFARAWSSTDPHRAMDLTNIDFTKPFKFRWYGANGLICESTATATGNAKEGAFTISSTTTIVGVSWDLQCDTFDGDYEYDVNELGLYLCKTNPAEECIFFE